jgi:hypothetical protein
MSENRFLVLRGIESKGFSFKRPDGSIAKYVPETDEERSKRLARLRQQPGFSASGTMVSAPTLHETILLYKSEDPDILTKNAPNASKDLHSPARFKKVRAPILTDRDKEILTTVGQNGVGVAAAILVTTPGRLYSWLARLRARIAKSNDFQTDIEYFCSLYPRLKRTYLKRRARS